MLLSLSGIGKTYTRNEGPVRALDGVSMELDAGDFLAVRGPSGCGKTTLLLAAGALLRPDAGRVIVDGLDPYALTPGERAAFRATNVGFVFQQFHLVPYLTVWDNVLAAAMARAEGPCSEDPARVTELLRRFGLASRAGHLPAELSTGERQRAAMARALLNRPLLLLADEPTGNLDSESADAVLEAITEFASGGGAVLLVTHDDRAAGAASRTLRMREGRIDEGS